MMRRLVEEDSRDPVRVEAARLFAAAPRAPHDPARKARVRRVLEADRPASHLARRRWRLALAAALLGVSVAASAMVGPPLAAWIRRTVSSPPAPTPRRAAVIRSEAPASAPASAPALVLATPTVAAPATHPASARRPAHDAAVGEHRATARSVAPASAPAPGVSPPHAAPPEAAAQASQVPPDADLVFRAVRALRQEHDPQGAGTLLDRYLARQPNGALAEEALGLAIEAAVARGDRRALSFAADYLRRFPGGRFAEVAARARLRFGAKGEP